ncbi:MAG: hypothetical protein K0R93_1184 [Anaerosolibacter sp.]|jgi:uncharacterized protein YecA (UPF0149 family)|uniref:SEC-C metal-binding domain-containing protein n=1 Tax=Anaerosolibacter sp. TaxID=1872527 RepID=UPI00260631F4|nr:SEC-C metal-binding domain-containing protein [Anaerosolibacter sp.]MDF2546286.1 hypothetical protein [Anaerosolibacter sp.]
MSLFNNWKEIAFEHKTQEEEIAFWKEFCGAEKSFYELILGNYQEVTEETIKGLAEKLEVSNEFVMGFLDGINDSLVNRLDLEEMTEDSTARLEIDFEKLFYNMHEAKADYLYTLSEWEPILSAEKRKEIEKAQKRSKIVVKEDRIGRNDPCTCGSGKKYKKCCGK